MRSHVFVLCGSLMFCVLSGATSPSGIAVADDSSKHPPAPDVAIHEAVLREVVRMRCQSILCLLSINKKPASSALLRSLAELGLVDAPATDDYEFANGVTKAFSRRKAQIIDVRGVKLSGPSAATVEVAMFATALDSTTCRYRVRRQKAEWIVDSDATRCTL